MIDEGLEAIEFFKYWPQTIARTMRRWWINIKLNQLKRELAYIDQQEENNRHVRRVLQGRQALLQSDLRLL